MAGARQGGAQREGGTWGGAGARPTRCCTCGDFLLLARATGSCGRGNAAA